jgi:hypothetical protein
VRLVISQPMYFPWYGHLEQLLAADTYVFYDDVQFSKGSFTNRVQLLMGGVQHWLTVPVRLPRASILIQDVLINGDQDWRLAHLRKFHSAYRNAPYLPDALRLLESVFSLESSSLCSIAMDSVRCLATYFGLSESTQFRKSSELAIGGAGSERVLAICRHLHASDYITGHGARNYLDHPSFEAAGVDVNYIDYGLTPYRQFSETFIPYVSSLDLVAMLGKEGRSVIGGSVVKWTQFITR